MKREEMIGKRFGRLTVIGYSDKGDYNHHHVLCKCDCGKMVSVNASSVGTGKTQSCGCLHREMFHEIITKHGHYYEKLHGVWNQMRQRCTNPNNKSYKYYGSRGITVCEQWNQYEPFRKWALESGYSEGLTLDRINTYGNYEPDNCRWITIQEQQKNRRPPRKRKETENGVSEGFTRSVEDCTDLPG